MNIPKDQIVKLTRRSYNCVYNCIRMLYKEDKIKMPYFTKLGDITQLSENLLLNTVRTGIVSLNNIKDCLKSYGLKLGMDLDKLGIGYDEENNKYYKK